MPASKRTRFECFKRDRFQCQYCGRTPPQVVLEADHVIPESQDGPSVLENLVTACFDCNRGKSDVPLSEVPKPLADSMALMAEKREQVEAYNAFLMEIREAEERQVEALGMYWYNLVYRDKKNAYVFTEDRITSVRRFLRSLPYAELLEAIDIAHTRKPVYSSGSDNQCFKYFCGVCWSKIRQLEGQ